MKPEIERFLAKVVINDSTNCWEWVGSKYRGGYGHFRRFINNKWTMGKSHRYSYEFYNNVSIKSMEGLVVCHTCDNPCCVNPKHLFLGTAKDNAFDMMKKNRNVFGRNSKHNWLSLDIAKKIRKCRIENPNLSYKEIGLLFNTSASQVHRIVNNVIWKN